MPKSVDFNNKGANDAILLKSGKYKVFQLQYYYERQRKRRYGSIEPEIHFDCKPQLLSWIGKQKFIRGCVMNLRDVEILKKLSEVEDVAIVVNYDDAIYRNRELVKLYDQITGIMREDLWEIEYDKERWGVIQDFKLHSVRLKEEDVTVLANGIRMFYHKNPDDKYPCIMHHKFLIGREEPDKILTESMLYGSFNMSFSSDKNLDSFLLFKQNQRLCNEFHKLQNLIWEGSIEHPMIKQFGFSAAKTIQDHFIEKAFDISLERCNEQIKESQQQDHPPEQQAAPSDN